MEGSSHLLIPAHPGTFSYSPCPPSHGEQWGWGRWQACPPPRWRQRVLSRLPCAQGPGPCSPPPSGQGGGGGAELEALNLLENVCCHPGLGRKWRSLKETLLVRGAGWGSGLRSRSVPS